MPPPNETFARPISVIITNTSSAATTSAATRLWLISTSNDFLTWSSRPSRNVLSPIQQLVRIRHTEVATGVTDVLDVVLIEQLVAVGIGHLERAHERRLNR